MSERILVIDDDQAVREILRDLLESEGYEVEVASDGLIAWERLVSRKESYDMLLLDLVMPRMDGIQLIRRLQHLGHGWLPPTIAISANSDAIQKVEGMGIHHTLTKPFDLEKVLALVALCRKEHALFPRQRSEA